MKFTAKKTRHKYAERYKLIASTGERGEVEKYADNDWRIRFGTLVGSTKHKTINDAAAEVFRCHREAMQRLTVI